MPDMDNVEIKFAQRLAANTRTERDRAVRKLQKYLQLKSQKPGGGFSRDDMLKIWKGLFYCMWMSDKMLVQEELSETLANLIHSLENDKAAMLYFETFLATMNREWGGIDRLRMDKFYMLCRNVLQESMKYVGKRKWDEGIFAWWLAILTNNAIMTPSSPNGLAYHIADIYLEEITKAGKNTLTTDQVHKLLVPYCEVAAKTKEQHFLNYIYEHLFEEIIETSEIAVEVMKAETENINHQDCLPDETPIKIDFAKLSEKLQSCAQEKNVLSYNIKKLYLLAKKFRELSEGRLPLDDFPDLSGSEDDDEEFHVEQSKLINRLVNEDEKEKREKKQLKRKKRKMERVGDEGDFVTDQATKKPKQDAKAKSSTVKAKLKPPKDDDAEQIIPIDDFYAQDNYIIHQAEIRKSKKNSTLKKRKMLSTLLDSDDELENNEQTEKENLKTTKMDNEKTIQENGQTKDNTTSLRNGHKKSKKKKKSAKIINGSASVISEENEFISFNDSKPVASFFRTSASKVQNKKQKHPNKIKATEKEDPVTPTKSSKKVVFEMSKIQVQQFRKNDKSMCVSPSPTEVVAFDPEKKPQFGLLKKQLKQRHKKFSK